MAYAKWRVRFRDGRTIEVKASNAEQARYLAAEKLQQEHKETTDVERVKR